jgi:hypothetical protein
LGLPGLNPPPPGIGPPLPGGIQIGLPTPVVLIKMRQPELKTNQKLKPFGWKRINLDP